YEVAIARKEGYKHSLVHGGISLQTNYILSLDKAIDSKQLLRKYFQENPSITAIVVTDDYVAMKVIQVCREEKIHIPNDLSIISFNNSFIAEVSHPSLTSVDTQVFQLGSEAAKCLIDEINDPSDYKKSIIIPTIIK